MRRLIAILALFNLLGVCFANVVQNGGFEAGDFSNWTLVDPSGNTFVDSSLPFTGLYSANLGAFPTDGTLTQDLATTPGQKYTLVYWLQNDGGTPNSFFASWNGLIIPDSAIGNDSAGFNYTEYSFTGLLATANSTPLQFAFEQTPAYWHLDNVVVVPVPEPSSLAILLSLFVGLGCRWMIHCFRY